MDPTAWEAEGGAAPSTAAGGSSPPQEEDEEEDASSSPPPASLRARRAARATLPPGGLIHRPRVVPLSGAPPSRRLPLRRPCPRCRTDSRSEAFDGLSSVRRRRFAGRASAAREVFFAPLGSRRRGGTGRTGGGEGRARDGLGGQAARGSMVVEDVCGDITLSFPMCVSIFDLG
ncbi:hypothetical protein THAOC_25543 [Thalassiosira oceanica]|uniref:Uncharacterized protein n=1 Tax=Thalassiosira oceanica TaxID=159749 RepID=K0RM56_THAOC|nr:hypothetical protein THAOC_25543 [Thalassiosira oceanica]|eukprot:EJK54798.1 hypothetical protein THAOC_25543 [Thalassiosira oceanica]